MSRYMKIKPLDTLFFRDAKPFEKGEQTWADSNFIPYPSTIWGAMFSVLYKEDKIEKYDKCKVSRQEREKLKIKNIYLYNEDNLTVLIPCPLDIYKDEDNIRHIGKYKKVDFISNYPYKIISYVETKEKIETLTNTFIEINSLYEHYQNGYEKNLILYDFDEVFIPEHKIGIEIDKEKGTTKEGQLYRVDMTRFLDKWSFLIEFEYECEKDKDFKNKGILQLGGETKSAKYEIINTPKTLKRLEENRKRVNIDEYCKIVFTTPSYFKDDDILKNSVVCANIGKTLHIGGFDLEKRREKEIKKYIPAGSVFVIKSDKENEFLSNIKEEENYKGFGLFEKLGI